MSSQEVPCFPVAHEMMHLAGGHRRARAHLTCVLDQVALNDRVCGKSIKGLHGTGLAPLTSLPLRISADRLADVCLAGGVWANGLLVDLVMPGLAARGLRVHLPRRVPPGDGGLCLGQALVAGSVPAEVS